MPANRSATAKRTSRPRATNQGRHKPNSYTLYKSYIAELHKGLGLSGIAISVLSAKMWNTFSDVEKESWHRRLVESKKGKHKTRTQGVNSSSQVRGQVVQEQDLHDDADDEDEDEDMNASMSTSPGFSLTPSDVLASATQLTENERYVIQFLLEKALASGELSSTPNLHRGLISTARKTYVGSPGICPSQTYITNYGSASYPRSH